MKYSFSTTFVEAQQQRDLCTSNMNAEQQAALALLGMQKSPSPSPGDVRKMAADNINKMLENSCSGEAVFPIASSKRRNSTDKYSSKKKLKVRNLSQPLPLKKRSKFEQSLHSKEPVSPIET